MINQVCQEEMNLKWMPHFLVNGYVVVWSFLWTYQEGQEHLADDQSRLSDHDNHDDQVEGQPTPQQWGLAFHPSPTSWKKLVLIQNNW